MSEASTVAELVHERSVGPGWRPTEHCHGWAKASPDGRRCALVDETDDGFRVRVVDVPADDAAPGRATYRFGPEVFDNPAVAIRVAESHLDAPENDP